ncbi:MAG: tetratricopeptide repeat protein [Deltaproteobacteria bacterium]|nr:tetratricopeptide repeat protein [Deltaproteobacteria bacterium]
MRKIGIIILIALAGILAPWMWAEGSEPARCPRNPKPMSEALYSVITEAERAAGAGDFQGAAAIVENCLEKHTGETHPYPYYDLGYFLHRAGKRDAAISYLRKSVKLNPCFNEAWQLLAFLHQEAGQYKQAATALEKAAAITKDPRMWYQTAVLWLDAALPKKALAILEKLDHEHRKETDWYVAAARAHQDLKQSARAAEAFESAYALSKDPEHLYQCAIFWLEAEKPGKALPLLKQLTKTASPKSYWLVALSNTLKALKKKEETARAMERAARISRDPNLYFHAAYLWLEANRPKKALLLLEKLAKRKCPQVEWLLALANTYMMLDQIKAAAITMDRVVQLDPKPEYLYNAGVLWLQAEQPRKALRHLLPLCKRPPAKAEWFVALAHAWLGRKKVVKAARAMEQAAHISGKPNHFYSAAGLWLQAERPRKALPLLEGLAKKPKPKAKWLVLLSETWLRLEHVPNAAQAMERAAKISRKNEHTFRAARLWLEADRPHRALPLLEGLAQRASPLGEWYIALSNCHLMLQKPEKAARAMERAAEITQKGEDYYRAGMLWLQAGNSAKAISLLRICAASEPVEQKWLVSLAQPLIDSGRDRDALAVMEKTALTDKKVSPNVRYQGAVLWLHLKRPRKALPILKILCACRKGPALDWLVSLVKTYVELEQMVKAEKGLEHLLALYPENPKAWRLAVWVGLQQADYAKAAAAMAVAVRLGPPDADQMKELADLYHMAGVPMKAAAALQKTWKENPTADDWDRLVNTYLSGYRYEMALASAKSAVAAEETAERWETVGAIAFRLQRFEESYDAYRRSADLTPDADIRLKAGYAALKMDNLDEAARLFKEAMRRAGKNSRTAYEAHRNLVFIRKMNAFREKKAGSLISPGRREDQVFISDLASCSSTKGGTLKFRK